MEDIDQSRTASVLTIIAGLWIALSPFVISVSGFALYSVIVLGAIIAVAGVVQLLWENTLPSWISGAASVLLFLLAIAPMSLGVSAVWNMLISAIVVFVLAVWDEIEVAHYVSEGRRSHQN
ncbi:MAG: hypothetical protein NTV39_01265 [Candidatus Saccharibacteria bacterium]|nr:hypothetical protein [Candidatus Saccharibacteria bacterium]